MIKKNRRVQVTNAIGHTAARLRHMGLDWTRLEMRNDGSVWIAQSMYFSGSIRSSGDIPPLLEAFSIDFQNIIRIAAEIGGLPVFCDIRVMANGQVILRDEAGNIIDLGLQSGQNFPPLEPYASAEVQVDMDEDEIEAVIRHDVSMVPQAQEAIRNTMSRIARGDLVCSLTQEAIDDEIDDDLLDEDEDFIQAESEIWSATLCREGDHAIMIDCEIVMAELRSVTFSFVKIENTPYAGDADAIAGALAHLGDASRAVIARMPNREVPKVEHEQKLTCPRDMPVGRLSDLLLQKLGRLPYPRDYAKLMQECRKAEAIAMIFLDEDSNIIRATHARVAAHATEGSVAEAS